MSLELEKWTQLKYIFKKKSLSFKAFLENIQGFFKPPPPPLLL